MKAMMSARLLGLLSVLLLTIGAAALWLVSSDTSASANAPLPAPPQATLAAVSPVPLVAPPAPSAKSREEKRFSRADRDDDGLISQTEYLATRRRNYDKLDANGDGRLDFDEYAASGITRFAGADADSSGTLAAAEFASTAPKAKKPVQTAARCNCAAVEIASAEN